MTDHKIRLGVTGENQAAVFLKKNGYRIVMNNYRLRSAEIDIIAFDKDVLCFIEVKTRTSDKFGLPQEAVSSRKIRKISLAALSYLKENGLMDKRARFDVVTLNYRLGEPKVTLIKNAFDLDERFAY